MYTQCPQCLTYFQVTPEHLKIAQGNVRCGQCRNVFSALGNLTEEPPQAAQESVDEEYDEDIFIDEHELDEYYDDEVDDPYIIDDEAGYEEVEQEKFDHAYDTPPPSTPEPIATPPISEVEAQSSLNQAIAAMQALQNNSSKLTSLEEGRESYRAKLQEIYDKSGKQNPNTSVDPKKFDSAQQSPPQQHLNDANVAIENISIPSSQEAESDIELEEAIHAIDELEIDDEFLNENMPIERQNDETHIFTDEQFIESSLVDEIDLEETIIGHNASEAVATEESTPSTTQNDEILQEIPLQDDQADYLQETKVEFTNDLYIEEDDLVSHDDEEIIDFGESEPQSNVDIKVKSLDRKPEPPPNINPPPQVAASRAVVPAQIPQPSKPVPAQTNVEETMVRTQAPMSLPAIPSQLRDDFEPPKLEENQYHFSITIWGVGGILLMMLFLGQTIYFKHDDLAKVQQLRPHIEMFCKFLSCELSLPSDVHRLELVSQDIRTHPNRKSALLVSVTFINNAKYVQSYPNLQITFSDLNSQKVAMRRFKPHEYLPAQTKSDAGMLPNTPVKIELEMMDPGSNAVNFEFDFFPAG